MNTEQFIPVIQSLFPTMLASRAVESPALCVLYAWITSNGFLRHWYVNLLSHLAATGFMKVVQNYWDIWNPCIYFQETMSKLQHNYNISGIDAISTREVNKCVRQSLSGQTVGRHDSDNAKALATDELTAVSMLLLFCLAGGLTILIVELVISSSEHMNASACLECCLKCSANKGRSSRVSC